YRCSRARGKSHSTSSGSTCMGGSTTLMLVSTSRIGLIPMTLTGTSTRFISARLKAQEVSCAHHTFGSSVAPLHFRPACQCLEALMGRGEVSKGISLVLTHPHQLG